ncbi:MAG: antitoxin [Candidatus Omnitrophota bacterium]
MKLDKEEQDLLHSIERKEWARVKGFENESKILQQAAVKTLKKDQRISIRLSKYDLDGLKLKAVDEGIPYQTIISSLIHKYITGRINTKIAV